MKKIIVIGLLSFALILSAVSPSFAWWDNDLTIVRIQQESNQIRVRLTDGTTEVNYLVMAAKENEMLAMLLTAQSSGLTVDANISGISIHQLRVRE